MSQATEADHDRVREFIDKGGSNTVQAKGAWTLPKCWRDEHDVSKGDQVYYKENDDGTLTVIPPE
jgi:bifunctional DNA-binding transcriptional regulator/antitoxin component of YhaV-PrlF toxin-antitoxin module